MILKIACKTKAVITITAWLAPVAEQLVAKNTIDQIWPNLHWLEPNFVNKLSLLFRCVCPWKMNMNKILHLRAGQWSCVHGNICALHFTTCRQTRWEWLKPHLSCYFTHFYFALLSPCCLAHQDRWVIHFWVFRTLHVQLTNALL